MKTLLSVIVTILCIVLVILALLFYRPIKEKPAPVVHISTAIIDPQPSNIPWKE